MSLHLIVLAAGEGTRMNSDTPKVLHEIAGAPLIAHALGLTGGFEVASRTVVVGHGADQVSAAVTALDPEAKLVTQAERLGTAHAVTTAAPALEGAAGDVALLFGDTPFIRPETLARMQDARTNGADIVVLGFDAADPARYGRLITDGDTLTEIVEWKDATTAQRAVTLCNSGVMLADIETLLGYAAKVGNDNAANEYYLTDVPALARADGLVTKVVTCDEAETLGINSRADLAAAEAVFQNGARAAAMDNGVTLQAPDTVQFAHDTHLGRDTIVEPNVVFGPGVTVETGARIRAFSHLEGCHVGSGAIIGPYARLRPGAELDNSAKVGNFVEIKNAQIGEGAKVNHLSYIGDATIGEGSNIGAGTITCNYDGVFKHQTQIGQRVFIGSNTMLVAPVSVGDDAMTATGSVVTKDVPDGGMAVARARQENKPNFARKYFEKLRAAKAAQKKG